jgi:hypothetical protein
MPSWTVFRRLEVTLAPTLGPVPVAAFDRPVPAPGDRACAPHLRHRFDQDRHRPIVI